MLFDSGFILIRPPLVSHFQLVRGRVAAKGAFVGEMAGHFVGHGGIGAAAGVSMAYIGGRPAIAKMGTVASLPTNSLVETASTGTIEKIRRETPICWERNGVLAAGTG